MKIVYHIFPYQWKKYFLIQGKVQTNCYLALLNELSISHFDIVFTWEFFKRYPGKIHNLLSCNFYSDRKKSLNSFHRLWYKISSHLRNWYVQYNKSFVTALDECHIFALLSSTKISINDIVSIHVESHTIFVLRNIHWINVDVSDVLLHSLWMPFCMRSQVWI